MRWTALDVEATAASRERELHHHARKDARIGGNDVREEYVSRINRVIDYIESNIDGDLSLQALSGVAHFSPFHFHRIFGAMVGETLNHFIERIRVEKAAAQLVANPKKSITQIAFDCGFAGSATFARAFRQAYGMSASEWRSGGYRRFQYSRETDSKKCKSVRKIRQDLGPVAGYPDGVPDDGAIPAGNNYEIWRDPMTAVKAVEVKVEEIPEFHVAYVRHIGPYEGNSMLFRDLFNKLMRWAGPRGLLRFPETKTLVVYHDSPEITDEDKLRISACITVPENTAVEGEVGKMAIPGGKYALARFELGADEFQEAWDHVCGTWLPDSGYQPDDRPCYELYYNDPEQHPQKKFVLDVCVPVKPL